MRTALTTLLFLVLASGCWLCWPSADHAPPPPATPTDQSTATLRPTFTARSDAEPPTVKAPSPLLTVEGLVLTHDDLPAAGARVWLHGAHTLETVTDAQGIFSLPVVPPGQYAVHALAGTQVSERVGVVVEATTDPVVLRLRSTPPVHFQIVTASGNAVEGARAELRLPPHVIAAGQSDDRGDCLLPAVAEARVEVSKPGYAPFSGWVGNALERTVVLHQAQQVQGTVHDDTSTPVEGARVTIRGNDTNIEVSTNPSGIFTTQLAPGSYVFALRHPAYASSEVGPLPVDSEPLIFRLERGVDLGGRVLDAGDHPVAEALVELTQATTALTTTTNADGRFAFAHARPGVAMLKAVDQSLRSTTARVDVPTTGLVELKMPPDARVSGVVVTTSGAPVPGVRVRAEGPSEVVSTTSGRDGRFELISVQQPHVQLRAADGPPVRVAAGARDVRLVVAQTYTVRGRVTTSGNEPLARYTLFVSEDARSWPMSTPRIFSGDFALTDRPAGHAAITAAAAGYRAVTREIDVNADIDLGTLVLEHGRSVRGRVINASGQPVPHATVVAAERLWPIASSEEAATLNGVQLAITDASGAFTLSGLDAHRAQLLALHPTLGRSALVALTAGQNDVALTLGEFGSVAGQATCTDNCSGALLGLTRGDETVPSIVAAIRADGRFELDLVPPGSYRLVAKRNGTERQVTTVEVQSQARIMLDVTIQP